MQNAIELHDTVTLQDAVVSEEGFMSARVRFARTGVQMYRGSEVGMPNMPVVRVYRPPEEVFHPDTMASFAMKPITNGHPPEMVKPENWKRYSVGVAGERITQDGDHLIAPIVISDAKAIADMNAGRSELSAGYRALITLENGTTPQGEHYDAVQRGIRGNHIALVDAGRCGVTCRIGDCAECGGTCSASDKQRGNVSNMTAQTVTLKTITVDGLPFPVNDAAEAIITKMQKDLADRDARIAALTADATKAQNEITARDGKIAALEQAVKDAALTPEKIDAAVSARTAVIDSAKKLAPNLDPKGKTESAIRREAVTAKLGDAAVKDKPDEYVTATFDTLVSLAGNATTNATTQPDPLRTSAPVHVGDAAQKLNEARAAYEKSLTDAYKGPAAK